MKLLFCALSLAALVSGGQQAPASAGAEAAIRAADAVWMKAIVAKSIEETIASYDPEAVTAGSAMFPAQGLQAFRENWTKVFAEPGFALTWQTKRVVITQSGAIAYSSGTWTDGKLTGPFLVVWRKQSDGKWKVLIDAAWTMPKPLT